MSTYANPHARALRTMRAAGQMTLIYRHRSAEYWLRWGGDDEGWEMFAEREAEAYLGTFDTRADALAYAKRHAVEG